MSKLEQITPTTAILYVDRSTAVALPLGPNAGGQPIAAGYEIAVIDNLGLASGTNPITITGQLVGGGTQVQLNVAGAAFKFHWTGSAYLITGTLTQNFAGSAPYYAPGVRV